MTNENKRDKFIKKSILKYGYKYDYSMVDYVDTKTPVIIGYGGVYYSQTPTKHLMGKCCEKITYKKTTIQFIKESIELWGDKYDYSLTEYTGSLNKVKIIFKNRIYEQIASSHLRYVSCEYGIDGSIFIDKCNLIYGDKYNLSDINYIDINKSVNITCNNHGTFRKKPFDLLRGIGCKKCKEYTVYKEISNFLDKYNIYYIRQHFFDDYNLPFDFYIKKLRTVIEFNGGNEKKSYCEDNYINIINVSEDNIHDIIWNSLIKDRNKNDN
jgi:hypothetical protein